MSNILMEQYKNQRLSHALIIEAHQETGRSLFNELRHELRIDPADLFVLDGEDSIKVSEIRDLIRFASMSRSVSPIKLIGIIEASRLTTESANALLKTLEEPSTGTHLILTTRHAETLLPTIRSRCQIIHVNESKDHNEEIVTLSDIPPLITNSLPTAFELSKELASSDYSLTDILNNWIKQTAAKARSNDHRIERILLDYLPLAHTSVNRRLLLDNLLLEIYNELDSGS